MRSVLLFAVQCANTSGKFVLLQVDYKAGHGDREGKFAFLKKKLKMGVYYSLCWLPSFLMKTIVHGIEYIC